MKKVLFIIIGVILLSCSERREYLQAFNQAKSQLDDNPDSTLQILNHLTVQEKNFSKSFFMKCQLLKLQALNKVDAPMDTISNVPEVINYYNTHGNHHEKMLSNYMMGRYYADKGDAPRALQFYRDAVHFADTTETNCDFKTLSRIYGQIASLFNLQRSPRLELEAERNAVYYARKANDTIAALVFFEHLAAPYHLMNMTDSALYYNCAASDSFIKYGYKNLAAGCRGYIIESYLNQEKNDSASLLIKDFENNSGAFSKEGKIQRGREMFYFLKGRLYENYHRFDSAIIAYQNLITLSSDINYKESAYKGLISVYRQINIPDSVIKYARLYTDANDSSNLKHSAEEIDRLQAVYNYNESLYIANVEKEKAQKRLLIIYIIIGSIIVIGAGSFIIIRRIQKHRRAQLVAISKSYSEVLNQFTKAKKDLSDSLLGYDNYRQNKELEIEQLKQALAIFQEDKSRPEKWELEDAILNSSIVKSMHSLASRGKTTTDAQWTDFENLIFSQLHLFYEKICDSNIHLTENEKRVCMLIRLRFIPSEQAVLLNLSNQRITNIRTSINKKLFNEKGTKMIDAKIRKME